MKSRLRASSPQTASTTDRIAPRKDSGAKFTRPQYCRNIVLALDVQTGDVVLEIGPGEGALTALLLETSARELIVVEYDTRAVELTKRFQTELASGRLRIIHSDVAVHLDEVFPCSQRISSGAVPLKIVGNIPYYITSDILLAFDEWARLLL